MKNFIILLVFLFTHTTHINAQEVYKWKDSNGKVHFGDKSKAPVESKKMDIQVKQIPTPALEKVNPNTKTDHLGTTPSNNVAKPSPLPNAIDPARVPAKCQGIIDKIAKVPAGTPWVDLYNDFNQSCPGLAYECVSYKRAPENNQCAWVERTDNSISKTRHYQ